MDIKPSSHFTYARKLTKFTLVKLLYENSINQDTAWSCLLCNIQDNLTNVPFTRCGNKELENINNSNTMAFTDLYQTKK